MTLVPGYVPGMSDFWFCVKHHRVEQGEDICPPIDRLGPFGTREEAEGALPKWND
jgi:hypothetical protein